MNDLEARQAIRGSLDETLVVEAAAGTGKTTELVRRLVAVLASGRGRVEGLVAVTFTEKAAGELKLRLRAALEDARHEQPAGSLERLRLEDALSRLEEARLSTLHGFCGDLLRERPVEARVDPLFSVLTEDEAERLLDAAFRTYFEDQLADLPEGLRRALCRRSRGLGGDGEESLVGRLRYAAYQLAGWRDLSAPYLRKPFPREETIDALVESVLSLADDSARGADLKDPLFTSTARLRRFAADLRKAERDRPRDHDGLEAALVELSHERDLKDKRKGRGTNYGDGLTREEIRTRRDALALSLGTFQKIADADLAACLKNELEGCLALYEKSKAARGALDFLDLLLSARDLLRRDESVRRDFGGRFTHVFVDEFQDTDPLQAELLLLLASDDPAVSDFRAVCPVPGKLFVVGDPKQAIYRFRRADPGTYREVKELLASRGARVVALTTSFRSVPSLQRVINAAFAPLMTGDVEADQPDYLALAPARAEPATSQPSVIALPVPKPFGWGEQVRARAIDECLPDVTGAFVKWLVESSGFTVEENGSRVPVAPRHVCLLFRRYTSYGRDVTRPYVEALEARSVPHVLVGGRSYHAREEILALRNALTALEWPDDELAVYATLKGPLFALADEDLFLWKEAVRRLHPFRVPSPAPEGLEEVGKALGLLAGLSRARNARPVSETIARLLAETRAHAGLIFLPAGEQALANVLHLAELARQYEASGGLSFRGFVTRLREDATGRAAPEAPLLEDGADGVRLMTAHRAKGLEFPVVILADITAKLTQARADRTVDASRNLAAIRLAGLSPWDLLDAEEAEKKRDLAEGVRLAYVAATRARDLLVVPAVGAAPWPLTKLDGEAAKDPGFASGWVSPLVPAITPKRTSWSMPDKVAGFGVKSVLQEFPGFDAEDEAVRPGTYAFGSDAGAYRVTWWDPARLPLGARLDLGVRRKELLGTEADWVVVDQDLEAHAAWRARRAAAIEAGSKPSLTVVTVRAAAAESMTDAVVADEDVAVEIVEGSSVKERPRGPRFGSLVHAVLAAVPLGANREEVAARADVNGRVLGATPEEIAAAGEVAFAALAHPLLVRARAAGPGLRRETPITLCEPDGRLIDGVLDLAFRESGGWTVVDFKTGRESGPLLAEAKRQVALYVDAVAKATGDSVRGFLLFV